MVGGCTMWLSRDGCDMARIEYEITSVPFEIMARSPEQWQKTSFLGAAKKKNLRTVLLQLPSRESWFDQVYSCREDRAMSNLSVKDTSSVESLMRHLTAVFSAIPENPTWSYRDVHWNKICFEWKDLWSISRVGSSKAKPLAFRKKWNSAALAALRAVVYCCPWSRLGHYHIVWSLGTLGTIHYCWLNARQC